VGLFQAGVHGYLILKPLAPLQDFLGILLVVPEIGLGNELFKRLNLS
jgi:hypothetical protein